MSLFATAHSAISARPPDLPVDEVERAVEQQFALRGRYSPLVSERDQNFRLTVDDRSSYVVKVTSLLEASLVSDFHIAALLHLASLRSLQVPKLVKTRDGDTAGHVDSGGDRYLLRVVSFLPGTLLASVEVDTVLARDFGAQLATLDLALQGFRHRGERPQLLWDLQRAAELRDLLQHVDDAAMRTRVTVAVDDFEKHVAPNVSSLRAQAIHGDANPENVLVDASGTRVSGFVDFGDMVRAPLVFDAAIAASYLRTDDTDTLRLITPFVAGYHATLPLTEAELSVFFDLVRARLATTVTLLYWRLRARPGDDAYRQKTLQSEAGAIRFLQALDDLGRIEFGRRLRAA